MPQSEQKSIKKFLPFSLETLVQFVTAHSLFIHTFPWSILVKCASDCEDQLAECLNGKEQQLLNTQTNAQHEINRITALEDFILRFRLGVRLMAECMDENDGAMVDGGGC